MGAVQFDAYDYAFSNVTVNYSGNAILDSPYERLRVRLRRRHRQHAVSGVNISNVTVQDRHDGVPGRDHRLGSVSGVTASGVGVAGTYNDGTRTNTAGAFTFNLGSGNSGWSTTPVLTAFPDPVSRAR
jgi:hypothetical protein